jgi:hypothetical protein
MHIELCWRNFFKNVNPKDAELHGRRTLKWVYGSNVVWMVYDWRRSRNTYGGGLSY